MKNTISGFVACAGLAVMTGALSACSGANPQDMKVEAFDGILPEETLYFGGNEPFWGGSVTGPALVYTTPERPDGVPVRVERFAGNGGLGLNGTLDDAAFVMAVTPGECSDTMSDRTYPFTVTLMIGNDTREGCGWTDAQPFEGDAAP